MRSLLRFVLLFIITPGCLPCFAAGNPVLVNADSLRPEFILHCEGLQQPPESLLSLHLLQGADTADVAVAAAYSRSGDVLRMSLLTELDYSGSYVIRWRNGEGDAAMAYRTPSPVSHSAARLLRRYPQADNVPANLLFLQFRFDAPMRPDVDAWTAIHIREDRPGAAEIPFAWRQRCFWLDSGRVLQLMVHPGRVKSGINYGGPLLVAGRAYRITIDSGLADAWGNSLPSQPSQRLIAGPEDHRIPILSGIASVPVAGTRNPLLLRFSEAMDYSGILTGILLKDDAGRVLRFSAAVSGDGQYVEILPVAPWRASGYRLELNAEIRDLGANTLRRRFEIRHVREAAKDGVPVVASFVIR